MPKIAGSSPRRIENMNPEKLGLTPPQRKVFTDCFGIEAIEGYQRRYPSLTISDIAGVLQPSFLTMMKANAFNNFTSVIEGDLFRADLAKKRQLK